MRKLGCFPAAVLAVLSCGEAARAGTLVDFNFANFGTVQVDLFDNLTPATVANFLSYANSGTYTNTIIHRSVPAFVIQGGGFDTGGNAVTTLPPIALDYSRANTRGTIAMARSTDANSATSQWFFNTVDNTSGLGPGPNGPGYTVFGWVVAGMSAVDNIAVLPTFPLNAPFGEIPLQNYTQNDFNTQVPIAASNLVTLSSVTVVGTHPSFKNPVSADDVNNDGTVKAQDALLIINDLLANGTHSLSGPFSGTNYLDTTGDGQVSPLDALTVINALLASQVIATPAMSAAAMPSALMAPMVVPEPSSFVLAAAGALAVAGYAVRRRMRRKRGDG